MKGYAKIRLAVFLCIMLVLPSIVSVLPMTAQEVSAGENIYMSWCYEISALDKAPVQIEKGVKFYVGDFVHLVEGDKNGCASMYKNVSYTSSKKSVATVNSKGLLTAKKGGTTTIKVKYKGKTISYKFKVVKKGSFSKDEAAKKLQKDVDKATASIPSKITKSNAFKCIKAENKFNAAIRNYSSDITEHGFLKKEVRTEYGAGSYSISYVPSGKLAVPDAGRCSYLSYLLYQYGEKNNPTSTRSSKKMVISSLSADTKQIRVKLKKAITAEQILGANIINSYINTNPNKKSAVVSIRLYDETANSFVQAQGTITKGSKILKIKPIKYAWVNNASVIKTTTFTKGHTYRIGEKDLLWGDGKTVKVK